MGDVDCVLTWWRASVGGVGGVLVWVEWLACLRGWQVSVGGVGGVLTWVTWLAC